MIDLTAGQLEALANRHVMRRIFIWVEAVDEEGDPDPAGFWDDIGDVEVSGRVYTGSGSVIQVATIATKSDMSIPGLTLTLSGLSQEASELVRAKLHGQEPVSVSFGIFDVDTRELIGPLIPMFVGFIDDPHIPTPAAGGDSTIVFVCESTSRALTRKSRDTRSHSSETGRDPNDEFYSYTSLQREKPTYFGRKAPKSG